MSGESLKGGGQNVVSPASPDRRKDRPGNVVGAPKPGSVVAPADNGIDRKLQREIGALPPVDSSPSLLPTRPNVPRTDSAGEGAALPTSAREDSSSQARDASGPARATEPLGNRAPVALKEREKPATIQDFAGNTSPADRAASVEDGSGAARGTDRTDGYQADQHEASAPAAQDTQARDGVRDTHAAPASAGNDSGQERQRYGQVAAHVEDHEVPAAAAESEYRENSTASTAVAVRNPEDAGPQDSTGRFSGTFDAVTRSGIREEGGPGSYTTTRAIHSPQVNGEIKIIAEESPNAERLTFQLTPQDENGASATPVAYMIHHDTETGKVTVYYPDGGKVKRTDDPVQVAQAQALMDYAIAHDDESQTYPASGTGTMAGGATTEVATRQEAATDSSPAVYAPPATTDLEQRRDTLPELHQSSLEGGDRQVALPDEQTKAVDLHDNDTPEVGAPAGAIETETREVTGQTTHEDEAAAPRKVFVAGEDGVVPRFVHDDRTRDEIVEDVVNMPRENSVGPEYADEMARIAANAQATEPEYQEPEYEPPFIRRLREAREELEQQIKEDLASIKTREAEFAELIRTSPEDMAKWNDFALKAFKNAENWGIKSRIRDQHMRLVPQEHWVPEIVDSQADLKLELEKIGERVRAGGTIYPDQGTTQTTQTTQRGGIRIDDLPAGIQESIRKAYSLAENVTFTPPGGSGSALAGGQGPSPDNDPSGDNGQMNADGTPLDNADNEGAAYAKYLSNIGKLKDRIKERIRLGVADHYDIKTLKILDEIGLEKMRPYIPDYEQWEMRPAQPGPDGELPKPPPLTEALRIQDEALKRQGRIKSGPRDAASQHAYVKALRRGVREGYVPVHHGAGGKDERTRGSGMPPTHDGDGFVRVMDRASGGIPGNKGNQPGRRGGGSGERMKPKELKRAKIARAIENRTAMTKLRREELKIKAAMRRIESEHFWRVFFGTHSQYKALYSELLLVKDDMKQHSIPRIMGRAVVKKVF